MKYFIHTVTKNYSIKQHISIQQDQIDSNCLDFYKEVVYMQVIACKHSIIFHQGLKLSLLWRWLMYSEVH